MDRSERHHLADRRAVITSPDAGRRAGVRRACLSLGDRSQPDAYARPQSHAIAHAYPNANTHPDANTDADAQSIT